MDDLIDRDKLIADIVNTVSNPLNIEDNNISYLTGKAQRQIEIIDIIKKQPKADTEKHGCWIERKYLNLIETRVYDTKLKKQGMICNIKIMVLGGKYSFYFTAYYDCKNSEKIIFCEDFVKRDVKFVIPNFYTEDEKRLKIEQIKELLGEDYADDVILQQKEVKE